MLRLHQIPKAFPGGQLVSDDYEIQINGQPCPVHACRVSAMPFNRLWPGHQRPLEQTELASYISFESDEPVELRVTPDIAFRKAIVRPLSNHTPSQIRNGVITFRLEKPGFHVLELDDNHHALHIFFNAPNEFPEKETATYYFGPGIHFQNPVRLKDNDSVYVDRDAIVYGAFQGNGVKNVRIFGHGVIDGSSCERIFRTDWLNLQNGNVGFYDSQNITVDGPILMNSPTWTARFFNCRNVKLSNVKIVGQWRYNTDGIDFCNSQNCSANHCFVRAFDDVLVVKGITPYNDVPTTDISFSDCVLWCDWGRTCEIGAETWGPEMARIRFADCDLIHNSCKALDIQAGGPAHIHDVTFENLRLEYQSYNLLEVYQAAEEMSFSPQHGPLTWFCIENRRWVYEEPYAQIDGISVKDVSILLEDDTPMPEVMLFSFSGEEHPHYHLIERQHPMKDFMPPRPQPVEFGEIVLQNVTVNGKPVTDIGQFGGRRNAAATAHLRII